MEHAALLLRCVWLGVCDALPTPRPGGCDPSVFASKIARAEEFGARDKAAGGADFDTGLRCASRITRDCSERFLWRSCGQSARHNNCHATVDSNIRLF